MLQKPKSLFKNFRRHHDDNQRSNTRSFQTQKIGNNYSNTVSNVTIQKPRHPSQCSATKIVSSSSSQKCGIQSKFLNPINYLSTCQFAKKRNILYKQYCLSIQAYYKAFNNLYKQFNQKVYKKNNNSHGTNSNNNSNANINSNVNSNVNVNSNSNVKQKNLNQNNNETNLKQKSPIFIKQFKSFLYDFYFTFHQVSVVHIQYFNELSFSFNKKQQILQFNTHQLIQKVKSYQKSQKQFLQSSHIHNIKLNQIYLIYQGLKKDIKQPLAFFNKKILIKKCKDVIDMLEKQKKLRNQLKKHLDKVYQNSIEYDGVLVMYRQQLFTNKYKILTKFIDMSKNSKNSLAELLVYLYDCVSRKSAQFNKFIKQFNQSQQYNRKRSKSSHNTHNLGYNPDDKLAVYNYLTEITQQHSSILTQIQTILRDISDFLQQLRKFSTNQSQHNKQILELLNIVYDTDENPMKQIFQALEFYTYFCKKICELINGVNIATNEFAKLKNQTKKLSQITISLVKNTQSSSIHGQNSLNNNQKQFSINQSSYLNQSSSNNTYHSQIQILLQKMSYDFPISFVHKIYKHFQQTLSYLKNHASLKFNRKKKIIEDSMEISYLDETMIKTQKRPCKKQVWLWEKWQDYQNFKVDQLKVLKLNQIMEFANNLIQQIPQSKEVERFSCALDMKSDPHGFLIIREKQLRFENSQGNCLVSIPIQLVENIKILVKIFGKLVMVETTHGNICFKQFTDLQNVIDTIQQVRNSSGAPIIKHREVTQVTAEELACMEERKVKVRAELPKSQDFQLIYQGLIENITIDHVYELIYSDKQITIKGKKEQSFFAYTMKKTGASNYQVTKYDSIGPKFYTHQQGVNFTNCPIFSSRNTTYDVKLPPVPFMPKYAQNHQLCKLFWVSNQQFQYYVYNTTTGAPKADTFYIQILHKCQKQQNNVKLTISWKITFTEDSYLKGTIKSNATEQTHRDLKMTAMQMKKFCAQAGGNNNQGGKGSDEQVNIGNDQEQQMNNNQKGNKFIKLLKDKMQVVLGKDISKTKVIVGVLVIVLMLNVVMVMMN